MRPLFFNREHTRTPYVQLNTRKCKACWACLLECPNKAIGKIDLPWHKHVLIADSSRCTGCLNCVEICKCEVYSKIEFSKKDCMKNNNKSLYSFFVNNLLLIFGTSMIVSGFVLQLGFHVGSKNKNHERGLHSPSKEFEQIREIDPNDLVWGINYISWSAIHKIAIVFFSLLMIYHVVVHWKWYKGVFHNHLINRNRQVIILSILFILVALTGLVPWFIKLSGDNGIVRLVLIEIHDKLSIILTVYLVLHVIGRVRWFSNTYRKFQKSNDQR
jgi:Pyruvate/2-oxoacid:ferredoxin oxidoreductase delta subunit